VGGLGDDLSGSGQSGNGSSQDDYGIGPGFIRRKSEVDPIVKTKNWEN